MFCPRCSHQQPSDDTRFCARCGLSLTAVCEAVERADAQGRGAATSGGWSLPAQKDLSTGALLMFAGAVAAVLWGFSGTRWPAEVSMPQAYFIMGGTLAFLLTLFHPFLDSLERLFSGEASTPARASRRREGVNLGALLMFVGALKAALITSLMPFGPERGLTTLAFMAGMLALVLLLRPILRGVRALFFKDDARAGESAADTARLDSKEPASALPPALDHPVCGFASARYGVPVKPPSVVEGTTRNLSDI